MIENEPDEALFPGPLAPFRTTLVRDPDHSAPVLTLSDLHEVLARFQQSVGGGRQSASSLWAQLYFNTLLIPATCLLAHDVAWVHRAVAIGLTVCPVSGTPLRCSVQTNDVNDNGIGWAGCLARHLDAIILDLRAYSRLSKGMLRESAERTVAWTLDEISRTDPAGAKAAAVLMSRYQLCSLKQGSMPYTTAVRQYCCLRDRLPNSSSCGDICPSRAKRRASY